MATSGPSSNSARPIDIEATFTDFVRAYGAEVGKDIFGASPDVASADYVFRSRKVVAELKRLVEDKSEDAEIRQKSPVSRGGYMPLASQPDRMRLRTTLLFLELRFGIARSSPHCRNTHFA